MAIEFNFDLASAWAKFLVFADQDPFTIALQLFFHGGWVIYLIVFIYLLYLTWLDNRQGQFMSKWKFVLLAIDIPKNNEQTPKAVESIFIALAGVYTSGNIIDRQWKGKMTESFSFEVVSLEGYVQFLVRTPTHFRDLVEAAIYAQYPEAEITEVEDYTEPFKEIKFPNEKYDLWGSELVLVKDYPYPIKTYLDFEYKLTGEMADPMANLLEVFSRFGPGEQMWIQIIVTPQPPGWGEKAVQVVSKITGKPYAPPETFSDKAIKPVGLAVEGLNSLIGMFAGESEAPVKKEEDQWKMFKISPGERVVFENMQRKLSKHAFRVKFRIVYLGEKPVFSKGRGVAAVLGAIQQFNFADANGFKPGKKSKTGADYFNVAKRIAHKQNRILGFFMRRNNYYGDDISNMFLSTEELASLWHFPGILVKAPSVEMISAKRVVPPTRLPYQRKISPVEDFTVTEASEIKEERIKKEAVAPPSDEVRSQPTPPSNLPTV